MLRRDDNPAAAWWLQESGVEVRVSRINSGIAKLHQA